MKCPICESELKEVFKGVVDDKRDKIYECFAGYHCEKCDQDFNHEGEEI